MGSCSPFSSLKKSMCSTSYKASTHSSDILKLARVRAQDQNISGILNKQKTNPRTLRCAKRNTKKIRFE